MAGNLVSVAVQQISKQRLGYNGISWDEWATALEPEITSGSKLEVGGSLYEFTANEDIDSTVAFAGFANDTIVYAYIQTTGGGETCVGVLSTTAPTYDEAKQGYYNGSDRCYGLIYKDSGGTYTQKTIIIDRERGLTDGGICLMNSANEDKILRFASDASIQWDESENEIVIDNNIKSVTTSELISYQDNSSVLLKTTAGTVDFDIMKPISAYFVGDDASSDLFIYQGGDYRLVAQGVGITYGLQLNPGLYRLNSAVGSAALYCTGVYGSDAITAGLIVT